MSTQHRYILLILLLLPGKLRSMGTYEKHDFRAIQELELGAVSTAPDGVVYEVTAASADLAERLGRVVANSSSTVVETLNVEESNVMLYLPIDSEAGIPSPKTAESLATLSLSHLQDIASLQLAPPSDKSQHDADVAAFEATPINRGRLDTRHNPIHE